MRIPTCRWFRLLERCTREGSCKVYFADMVIHYTVVIEIYYSGQLYTTAVVAARWTTAIVVKDFNGNEGT